MAAPSRWDIPSALPARVLPLRWCTNCGAAEPTGNRDAAGSPRCAYREAWAWLWKSNRCRTRCSCVAVAGTQAEALAAENRGAGNRGASNMDARGKVARETQIEVSIAQIRRAKREEFQFIHYRASDSVSRLTLNRPDHNLLNEAILRELAAGIEIAGEDDDTKLIMIDSALKVFSGGID